MSATYYPPQPQAQPQAPQTVMQPQYGAPAPAVHAESYPKIVETKKVLMFTLIGVTFLLLSAMLVHISPEITNKDYTVYNDQDRQKMKDADMRTQTTIFDVGNVLKDLGAFMLVAFLLLAAIFRVDWPDYVRFGLFLAIGLFLLGFAFR